MFHHDISIYNLAYLRGGDGKLTGVLLDFELAITDPMAKPTSEERSGTIPFMAHDYMFYPEKPYELCYEYESFLYCAIWHGLGYDKGSQFPRVKGETNDILYSWRVGTWGQMTIAKNDFLHRLDDRIIAYIPDETFAKKCDDICQDFFTFLLDRYLKERRPISYRPETLEVSNSEAKITYLTLYKTLGVDPEPCTESCCI